jgi:hypothetical protein
MPDGIVIVVIFSLPILVALIYLDLRRLIMATKQDALDAIAAAKATATAEHEQVLAAVQALKDVIANRPEVPDDVVAAISTLGTDIEAIFTPEPETPTP